MSGFCLFGTTLRPKLLHIGAQFFEKKEHRVWVNGGRILLQGDTFYMPHDMLQNSLQWLAPDVNNSPRVFIFPIKLAADVESVLFVFADFGRFVRFPQHIPVSICAPHAIDSCECCFGTFALLFLPFLLGVRLHFL